ncbi:MAG: sugar phosphate nucleotidyltransferase [Candidatus Coatesbacteria bacterium]
MKGVILAGGLGTRLHPLTRITNKHLLPVYDKPMIYYPLQTLVNAGIRDVMIVTGGQYAGEFLRLVRDGREFGLRAVEYAYQEGEGGIADALRLAERFVGRDRLAVVLGDNIVGGTIRASVEAFQTQRRGARILLKAVDDPQHYGCPDIRKGKITAIQEKPKKPRSPYAVTGIYLYDSSVFSVVRHLRPSARGELEITDVNNHYVRKGWMAYDVLDGWWGDAGESIEAYLRVQRMVAEYGANKVA